MKNNINSGRRTGARKVAKNAPKRSRLFVARTGFGSSKKYIMGITRMYNQELEDIENFAAFAKKKVEMTAE